MQLEFYFGNEAQFMLLKLILSCYVSPYFAMSMFILSVELGEKWFAGLGEKFSHSFVVFVQTRENCTLVFYLLVTSNACNFL